MLGFSPLAAAPLASTGFSGEQYNFSVNAGTFTTTGQTANFQIALRLDAERGAFALSVQGAAKIITEFVPDGQFVVAGNEASFVLAAGADAAHGNFNVTGQNVNLTISLTFDDLVDAQYIFTGQPITFGFGMGAVNGSFTLTGQDITEDISDRVAVGTFTVTFNNVTLQLDRMLAANNGQFTYVGYSTAFRGFFDVPDLPAKTYTEQIVAAKTYTEQTVASANFTEQTTPVSTWTESVVQNSNWTDAA